MSGCCRSWRIPSERIQSISALHAGREDTQKRKAFFVVQPQGGGGGGPLGPLVKNHFLQEKTQSDEKNQKNMKGLGLLIMKTKIQ